MTNNTVKISRFDVAEVLTDEETIQAYLNEMLLEGTPSEFVQALNDVARARGMNEIAKGAGIGRESLYKSLKSPKPRFETLAKVLDSLGLQLQVVSKSIEPNKHTGSSFNDWLNNEGINQEVTAVAVERIKGFITSQEFLSSLPADEQREIKEKAHHLKQAYSHA